MKLRRNNKASVSSSKNHVEKPFAPLPHAASIEAFQNHWRQALSVIKRPTAADGSRSVNASYMLYYVKFFFKIQFYP